MTKTATAKLSVAQTILLVVDDLIEADGRDPNEWEITVAAWKRKPKSLGLRGYETLYPDHQLVLAWLNRGAPEGLVARGWLKRSCKRTYKITSSGRTIADMLLQGKPLSALSAVPRQPEHIREMQGRYDLLVRIATNKAFHTWQDDPSRPRDWLDASRALGMKWSGRSPFNMLRISLIRDAILKSVEWCNNRGSQYLQRDPESGSQIQLRVIHELDDFVTAMVNRFPQCLSGKGT